MHLCSSSSSSVFFNLKTLMIMVIHNCRKQASFFIWVLLIGLLTQNLVIPVMARSNFGDQKNYYSPPDPRARTPPTGSPRTPSHRTTPPSHGGGGGYGGTPPTFTTPSNPPSGNCGSPPTHVPTPSNPPSGNCGCPPTSVPTPPSGGGGYNPSPPTPTTPYVPTPTTPTPTPTTPYVPTPTTPTPTPTTPYVPTPTTPTPTTPYVPSPPFTPDPNSPFTCNYWRNHPGIVWGLLGWWGTVGNAFGVSSLPGIGATMTIQQALSNTRSDGYGTLYREGTASFLNSMVTNRFPFTTKQVRDSFVSGLRSNKAAAAQGHIFKMANEGKLKPRA